MDVKARIIQLLEQDRHSFEELAEYLDMSQEELSMELSSKTLELRKLETISKVLRVPLYSFFRNDDHEEHAHGTPYYIRQLWTEDEAGKTILQLESEIKMLKQILSEKEEQVRKLRS